MMASDMRRDQAILNAHGLKPKHRFLQQHPLMSGLNGRATLHDELEAGRVVVRRGIARFTRRGVVFSDDPDREVPVDVVVLATGYKQTANFVDPRIVDLSFDRKGNDVLLYKYTFPISREFGDSIAFVNLLQSVTFLAADLQCRAFFEVFFGRKRLPDPRERLEEVLAVRKTMAAQYIDRHQLRVQAGAQYAWYEDLAEFVGVRPTLSRLLRERPSAIWHAFFVTWCPLQYRLVGPGRFEAAEQWIEERFATRFYSERLPDGRRKPGPVDRGGLIGTFNRVVRLVVVSAMYWGCRAAGYKCGPAIQDHLDANLAWAERDAKERGIPHQLEVGGEVVDPVAVAVEPKRGRGRVGVWLASP